MTILNKNSCHFVNLRNFTTSSHKSEPDQGPLITDGRNRSKWTGPFVGLYKTLKYVKMLSTSFENTFKWIISQVEGVREVIFFIRLLLHHKTFKIKPWF